MSRNKSQRRWENEGHSRRECCVMNGAAGYVASRVFPNVLIETHGLSAASIVTALNTKHS